MIKLQRHPESLIDSLLLDYIKTYKNIWLLTDPRAGVYPQIAWHEAIAAEQRWVIRDPQDKHSHDSKCLQLFKLSAADIDLIKQSVSIAKGETQFAANAICGWFVSPRSSEMVIKHLMNMLDLQDQSQLTRYMFRYYDRRVLNWLIDILSPKQLSNLLGTVEHYIFNDRFNEVITLSHDSQVIAEDRPCLVSTHQRERIEKIKWCNKTLSLFKEIEQRELPKECEPSLMQAIEKAYRLQLSKASDIVAYGYYSLIYGEQFNHRQDIEALITDGVLEGNSVNNIIKAQTAVFLSGI
ncbi:DUF4123 domain-containing protein [Pragia fontium]|uniref:DUF4123 domain-containing protein n=1 Tax=Pragia fontium TaxID=82985 RepID=UPI000649A06A|nr:DUF4123 domain-containing protein [Pragia fontium]AKJ42113.1 hypothetical protein QQ39_08460 [Pragia fontium]